MILWLKDKHLKISLDGEVVYCWYDMLMTTVVKDEEVENRNFNDSEDLNGVLVCARDDLDGVQALERAQLREDVPHCDRLTEVQDDVPLSW